MNFYKKGHREMVYTPPVVTEQECRACNAVLPLTEFEERRDTGKHRTECRECRAIAEVARRYSITVPDVHALFEQHGNACQICGSDGKDHATFKRLVVDHCHSSGKVRGLLCSHCNSALGHLRDSPQFALNAAAYLQQHS